MIENIIRWSLHNRFLVLLFTGLLVAWGVGYVFTQHLYSPLPW